MRKKCYFVRGSALDALLLQRSEQEAFDENPLKYLEDEGIITEFEFTDEERAAFMLGVESALRYDDDMVESELYDDKQRAVEAIVAAAKEQKEQEDDEDE